MTKTSLAALLLATFTATAGAQSGSNLEKRMIERRAVEAVIRGMPAVNGPKPEFFEKKWVLPDVERLAESQ